MRTPPPYSKVQASLGLKARASRSRTLLTACPLMSFRGRECRPDLRTRVLRVSRVPHVPRFCEFVTIRFSPRRSLPIDFGNCRDPFLKDPDLLLAAVPDQPPTSVCVRLDARLIAGTP